MLFLELLHGPVNVSEDARLGKCGRAEVHIQSVQVLPHIAREADQTVAQGSPVIEIVAAAGGSGSGGRVAPEYISLSQSGREAYFLYVGIELAADLYYLLILAKINQAFLNLLLAAPFYSVAILLLLLLLRLLSGLCILLLSLTS